MHRLMIVVACVSVFGCGDGPTAPTPVTPESDPMPVVTADPNLEPDPEADKLGGRPPQPMAPVHGAKVPIDADFLVQNPTVQGAVGRVSIEIEVASDAGFTSNVFTGRARTRDGGETTVALGMDLAPLARFFWRARAAHAGKVGVWSYTASFSTLDKTRPVDPRFDDAFWREFAFDAFDKPAELRQERLALWERVPNIHIWETSELRQSHVDHIRAAAPQIFRELTGWSFTGRITTGPGPARRRANSITVEITSNVEAGYCGWANYGPGSDDWAGIQINPINCSFERIFAHEMGHALGFRHVSDYNSVMYSHTNATRFTARERYHGRLAYEVGPGLAYCGWPYSAGCDGVRWLLPPDGWVVN